MQRNLLTRTRSVASESDGGVVSGANENDTGSASRATRRSRRVNRVAESDDEYEG